MGSPPKKANKEEEDEEKEEEAARVSVWDCGSPLYDSFELVSVSHILDRNSMILPFSRGSRRWSTGKTAESSEEDVCAISRMGGSGGKGRGLFKLALLNIGLAKPNKRKFRVSEESRKRMKATLHGFCASLTFWRKYK
ncbi:hypothetical protein H6P81_014528 [Aristolochia fimbriata]|uniref:Uncharacterized protein n=1 Tax=Aristolochia fimbriata TaxID=158543 RepID=A0AAV7EHS8_ARIFI|nr:hypothetical protein H6P81_014528 [Aristolochia fimbriata]